MVGLAITIAVLVAASLTGQVIKYHFGHPTAFGLVTFFYLDHENSLPTWYQSMVLLFASALLAGNALTVRRDGAPFFARWAVLSALFLFFSLDEAARVHERTIEPLQRLTGIPQGMWAPTWVFLGLAFVLIFAAFYLEFVLHLRPAQRIRLLVGGFLFVLGAVGVEMATAKMGLGLNRELKESFDYAMMVHVEEALEMIGAAIFIDFLLRRLDGQGAFRIAVAA